MELRLPGDKLSRLRQLIDEWLAKRPRASVKKRDLASLVGHLQHAGFRSETHHPYSYKIGSYNHFQGSGESSGFISERFSGSGNTSGFFPELWRGFGIFPGYFPEFFPDALRNPVNLRNAFRLLFGAQASSGACSG